jgi:hypothetical protein
MDKRRDDVQNQKSIHRCQGPEYRYLNKDSNTLVLLFTGRYIPLYTYILQ